MDAGAKVLNFLIVAPCLCADVLDGVRIGVGAGARAAVEHARQDLADAAAHRQVERPGQVVLKGSSIYSNPVIKAPTRG
jgi:hypothetical protein